MSHKYACKRWGQTGLGVSLKVANTERVSGWAEVLHRLGDPANGVPARLFIHERCARLAECLPSLQHDPKGCAEGGCR